METLYNITDRFVDLMNRDDLTEEEFTELGNELALNLQNKATNIVGYNFTLEQNKNTLKQEIERLQGIYTTIELKQEKFKQYVKENMEKLGIEKIETPLGNLTIKKNPASVEIVNKDLVNEQYIKTKEVKSIDKNKIKEELKLGLDVQGCLLKESTRLEIK